jgi:alpha-beta hydrolase superfamily lysophospholipase
VVISKLVLLPGMDGTGELFEEFLSNFDGDYIVIPLPQSGSQDHVFLANIIKEQLPTEDFVLLAESFAGGIIPELLRQNNPHLKGVIFIASFLSSPNQLLLSIAKFLPIKSLASAPLSTIFHKFLLLGQGASKELLSKFITVTKSIPDLVLKNRLEVMSQQRLPITTSDIPSIYIKALSDRLITSQKGREFTKVFSNIKYIEIEGPHFILQAQPKESARLVTEAISLILKDCRYS